MINFTKLSATARRLALAASFGTASLAAAADLPSGRYRCYEPPTYVVTAWFDIEPNGTYRFQGESPARFRYDARTRDLTWIEGALATHHSGGRYEPPAAGSTAAQRHTIVLLPRGDSIASECYLTTH